MPGSGRKLNKEPNYNHCDIPLDDRILDFYNTYRKLHNKANKDEKVSWSKIDKTKYNEIENNLKSYIDSLNFGLNNNIEAEFIIWEYATA